MRTLVYTESETITLDYINNWKLAEGWLNNKGRKLMNFLFFQWEGRSYS